MQDIDFDELDKAVSSVMDTGSPSEPAEPVSVPEEKTTPVSPATRRSTGRFMDVVHPSSDMRSGAPSRPQAQVAPRPVTPPAPAPTPEPAPQPVVEEEASSSDVLDSPFLTDAKVEKRPLGAFSDALHSRPDFSRPTQELLPAETEDEKSADTSSEQPSAEELTAETLDLTALEAVEPETPEQPEEGTQPEPETAPAPKEVTVAEPTAALASASIPQQYKEQPVSADQPTGAIFDTENYHQPLAHPPKKSSGWWAVLWIIGLIIIGGGIGAALYYFVLPQL